MITREVLMKSKAGLHARPASQVVAMAKKYESKITIINGEKEVDAKSIIKILTIGAKEGTQLVVTADGADEVAALEEIATFIADLDE
ncbi:HPr family phosphocarrier protein [Chakrabartyella piscis]|uniref:HPr family phosphocarrier protein n=1 Tax=Chakrabartyella piscis TaxID=2918914 RepID=UPI0029589995|nr:HPr family phosphocarrier protein [Chakrabartyella piscis]